MTSSRPLTALADARAMLLAMLAPVDARDVSCATAQGLIAADDVRTSAPQPVRSVALLDGYALCAEDIAGASSFAPVFLASAPLLAAPGDELPPGCDCVVEAAALDMSGPAPQVFVESYPGENVRRAGEDFKAGALMIPKGRRITALDALAAASAGVTRIVVRRPRVMLLDTPDEIGILLAALARAEGADIVDAGSAADLVIACGAMPAHATILAQGLALEPGRDSAIGRMGATPMIVLPRQPGQAFAGFIALVRPALDALAARAPRPPVHLLLTGKISSRVGVAEIALLHERGGGLSDPLSVGDCTLRALTHATHVALIAADSEGCRAGDFLIGDPLDV